MRRILIVDDHPMIASALMLVARSVDPTLLVDIATTLSDAEARLHDETYALILLDLLLPDIQGFAGLALLQALRPTVPIALVTSREESVVARQALALGARGFIAKSTPIEGMVNALRVLLEGGLWFPNAIMFAGEGDDDAMIARVRELTHAQLKVLHAIASGRQNKQIAHDLGIAEPTLKAHLATVFKKLGVNNRTQAVLALQAFDAAA